MQSTALPTKFLIPFANAAGSNYIRPIPQASQIAIQAGAASLTDGFPPVNFLPVAAGGTPPFGQDHNGILNQITAWVRALCAGTVVPFDAAFQAAIGGYPLKAHVYETASGVIWESRVENNTAALPTGAISTTANWQVQAFADPGTYGLSVVGTGGQGASVLLTAGSGVAQNKTLRSFAGNFDVLNNAHNAAILTATDAGALFAPGDITSSFGHLRANIGAFGSNDQNCGVILADFQGGRTGANYERLPDGLILQWGRFVSVTGNADVFNFPITFPTTPLGITGCDDGSQIASCSFNFLNAAQLRMWCGFQNNGVPIYTSGTGILWIAVGY